MHKSDLRCQKRDLRERASYILVMVSNDVCDEVCRTQLARILHFLRSPVADDREQFLRECFEADAPTICGLLDTDISITAVVDAVSSEDFCTRRMREHEIRYTFTGVYQQKIHVSFSCRYRANRGRYPSRSSLR